MRSFDNVIIPAGSKLYDMFIDILMDTHLSSVIDKRILAVQSSCIDFRRDGKVDETIGLQIRSPWLRRCIADIMWAKFWGFSLMQFYKDGEWLNYDLIPRKHVDPIRKLILRHQSDLQGTPGTITPTCFLWATPRTWVCWPKAAPWVIYKRNTTADWAQFSEVFGMPIRTIYETDDDDARQRAIDDAENQEEPWCPHPLKGP